MNRKREYGHAGTIGITVPQANTTVEAEFRALAPAGVNVMTARLQGSRSDSRQRLLDYFHTLGTTLDTFDNAPLGAAGFACTGSSYLLGVEQDRAAFADLSHRRGYAVVPATEAILASLRHIGARRVTLVSPYPEWLTGAALDYWRDAGIEIIEVARVTADAVDVSDTRNVYDIGSADAVAAARRLKRRDMDALLLSGTGMPTLRAIGELAREFGKPVLSSTLCLAWALGQRAGIAGAPPWEARSDWESRLDRL
ncbi:MAG: maleate cis-trans isomerase family protein [Betaproteobacteria bacterium]